MQSPGETEPDREPGYEFVQVHITVPVAGLARDMADDLVGSQLAACVQVIGDIGSVYTWDGDIERADESLIIAKTATTRFAALAARVRERHPYEVPQVTATPIVAVDEAYAAWMRSVLGD